MIIKKLLFIGPKFHEKTGSTRFLIDLLAPFYAIKIVSVDIVKGADEHNLSCCTSENYDVLLCLQVMLTHYDLETLSYDLGVFCPMYDGCPSPYKVEKWLCYRDFKIISFSRKLAGQLYRIGMDVEYIQYFPKPIQTSSFGDSNGIYLWNRREEIGLDCLYTVTPNLNIDNVHVHRAMDPTQEFKSADKQSNVSVTYSEWYEHQEDMLTDVCKYAYYMAPRAREGIGMSFLEAMAAGRCVIAPNESTMNEYITDGVNGCLYDLKSPKPVAVKDVRALQDAASAFIAEGYEKWLVESAQIMRWMKESPMVNNRRFNFWLIIRFLRSPVTVLRRLL
jgi:glycosyltransferase involved in cell wall biosynthesis